MGQGDPQGPAGLGGSLQGRHALTVHDVHVIRPGVGFQGGCELGTLGVGHRDVVLNAHRVQSLAAEALGHDARADALAGCVHRRGGAGRAATYDQHVKRILLGQAGGISRGGVRVHFG